MSDAKTTRTAIDWLRVTADYGETDWQMRQATALLELVELAKRIHACGCLPESAMRELANAIAKVEGRT